MEKFEVQAKNPLEIVKKYCENFDGGNIIMFADGHCNVERLNAEGIVIGIYMFDKFGDLSKYTIAHDNSGINEAVESLKQMHAEFEVIALPRKVKSDVKEKTV